MSIFTVSTKQDKDSAAVSTKLEIDWEGASVDDLKAIAAQGIVIKWQASARKNGIPSEAKIRAVDFKPNTRVVAPPQTIDQLITKLSAEERAKLLEKLMAE